MILVNTCWTHVEVTFQMYPRCVWWIHWGENNPEPAMYPGCSHWFPGHLAPSDFSPSPWLEVFGRLVTQMSPCRRCHSRDTLSILQRTVILFHRRSHHVSSTVTELVRHQLNLEGEPWSEQSKSSGVGSPTWDSNR